MSVNRGQAMGLSAAMSLGRSVSSRELIAAFAGLLGLVVLQIAATDSFYLLHKYLWSDELCTYALLTDPSLTHAARAMRGSVDINPPGLHILLLAYLKIANSTSELALRSFALLSMVVGLTGLYAVLRGTYGVLIAVAATLAVWSHPLILDHAFEVRYYGPWLAAAVWFSYFLGQARAHTLGRAGVVMLAVTSFFLCTIHYFGIVTLVIIAGCEWLWRRGRPAYARAHLAAMAVGPLALVAAVVFLLPSQRAATTVSTWVPAPTVGEIAEFLTTLFLPLHLGAVILVAWLSRLTAGEPAQDGRSAVLASGTSAVVGLTSLLLFAPALIGFSFVVQSVLVGRYGLPAIAALAPAVAYSLARVTRGWAMLLVAFLIAGSSYELHQRNVRAVGIDAERRQLIETIRTQSGGQPVVFEAPHQLYVVWHYAPDLRKRVFLLDFEPAELGDNVSTFRIWTRDLARQFVKFYDAPAFMPWEQARRADRVYIVPHHLTYIREPAAGERYPQFVMTRVQGQLHQLVRAGAR
jgi:hypothetical protein